MPQCDSKVFFPDDPTQAPQFSDCPREAETTRRTIHSVVKLCAKCAEVWDEQEREVLSIGEALVKAPTSNAPNLSPEVPTVTRMREAGHRAL
jgi:hypothetical protein